MIDVSSSDAPLMFRPLTTATWSDLETLFGERGGYGGCWCMFWRTTRAEFSRNQGQGNRSALKDLVEEGVPIGLLAYQGDHPVGWISVAPRHDYGSLNRSPVLRPVDDQPVWSIVCLLIDRQHRGQRLTVELIRAAIRHVNNHGGRILEAYPTLPRGRELAPVSSYMGTPSMFEAAGFKLVARPSEARAIYRYEIH